MSSSAQILLPLERRRPDRFEDFVPGPNANVVDALRALLQGKGGQLFIRGGEGSGKSHLLNATCNQAQAQQQSAFYLPLGALPDEAADSLAGLETMDVVCFDDIDRVAGNETWEHALFHCFNRLRANGGRLVVSSTLALSQLPLNLPDLASRLSWDIRLRLQALEDADKLHVLEQRARAVGIELAPEVGRYLLSRGTRNLAVLLDHLESVRVAALKRKRKITIPLAREVLLEHTPDRGSDGGDNN